MHVETYSPLEVTAEVKKYTLVGDDIYVKRYTNDTVPTWYRSLISDIIASDLSITDINTAIDVLENLQAGFNQSITHLQNKDELIDAALTSLVTKDNQKTAAIMELNTTKVDAQSAQAIALNTVATYFTDGSAAAWFNTKIATLASQTAAYASSISTLVASLDNAEARIIQSYTVEISNNLTYRVVVYSSNGSLFRNGIINTILTTKIYKATEDITATIPPAKFSWVRKSNDVDSDTQWNQLRVGVGNVIPINSSDVFGRAVFECIVTLI
jgi:hypothetical protein